MDAYGRSVAWGRRAVAKLNALRVRNDISLARRIVSCAIPILPLISVLAAGFFGYVRAQEATFFEIKLELTDLKKRNAVGSPTPLIGSDEISRAANVGGQAITAAREGASSVVEGAGSLTAAVASAIPTPRLSVTVTAKEFCLDISSFETWCDATIFNPLFVVGFWALFVACFCTFAIFLSGWLRTRTSWSRWALTITDWGACVLASAAFVLFLFLSMVTWSIAGLVTAVPFGSKKLGGDRHWYPVFLSIAAACLVSWAIVRRQRRSDRRECGGSVAGDGDVADEPPKQPPKQPNDEDTRIWYIDAADGVKVGRVPTGAPHIHGSSDIKRLSESGTLVEADETRRNTSACGRPQCNQHHVN
ncbi:hypothetical protein Q7P37_009740 [Cladosporium fusiforme]